MNAMTTTSAPVDPARPDPDTLAAAADLLKRGNLVAYPTETFYALGADATQEAAVDRVFTAKGRPQGMALPVILGDRDDVPRVAAALPEGARALMDVFWPGPLTLVLPAAGDLPARLLGGGKTIGVRVSSHPVAQALARACGRPLVATSANRTGQPPPATAAEVAQHLGGSVATILDAGRAHGGAPSTIVDLTTDPPRLVRAGPISALAIESALGRRLA